MTPTLIRDNILAYFCDHVLAPMTVNPLPFNLSLRALRLQCAINDRYPRVECISNARSPFPHRHVAYDRKGNYIYNDDMSIKLLDCPCNK